MTELQIIALAFFILELLLLIINYIVFTKHPSKKELMLGASVLKNRGPKWFVIYKFILFIVLFSVLLYITPLLPIHYSYFYLGLLLGTLLFNVIHDLREYQQ